MYNKIKLVKFQDFKAMKLQNKIQKFENFIIYRNYLK